MISTNDRAAIFGRTGTGKTHLVKHRLLPGVRRFAIADPKGEFTFPGAVIRTKHDPKPDKVIYRSPVFGRFEKPYWDDLFHRIFEEEGKRLLVVDETHFVTRANPTSEGLARFMRMGRSKGKGVWLLTQSTAYVPHEMRSQTEHVFVFHMQDEADLERIAHYIGKDSLKLMQRFTKPGHEHDFIYYHTPRHKRIYYHQPYTAGRRLHVVPRTA